MEALNDLREVVLDLLGKAGCGPRRRIHCDDYASCNDCRATIIRTAANELEAALGAKAEIICAQNREIAALKERAAMPEGMEWPMFNDGELVKIGDEVDGLADKVFWIKFNRSTCDIHDYKGSTVTVRYGGKVKRIEPADTQERIYDDAKKHVTDYWGCMSISCEECPAKVDGETPEERYGTSCCRDAQMIDLLRRQIELCEREKGDAE